jgi:hypothetical protein
MTTTQNPIAEFLIQLTERFGSVDAGAAALVQYVSETKEAK